ncbi:MAG: hypothetical protein IPO56_14705 [Flavobacteriales bacterium]|nr:hypothetical protein [Flavobacteriales bacterium]
MRSTITALCFGIVQLASASGEGQPVGALRGMGYVRITVADLWSLRLNPAGLAGLDKPMAGAFYQSHYLSQDLAQQGLAVAIPLGKGTLGIGAIVSGIRCTTRPR